MSEIQANNDDDDIDELGEDIDESDIISVIPLHDDLDGDRDDQDIVVDDGSSVGAPSVVIDNSTLSYKQHSGQIYSVSLLSNGLIASGGEDDKALVWSVATGQVYLNCVGHKDSVTYCRANAKQTLLCTGDISGRIGVWDLNNKQLLIEYHVGDLEWLLWHPVADILLAGTADGEIWMWLVSNQENIKVYPTRGASCMTGCLFSDGKRLLAGYKDGLVKLWHLKSGQSQLTDRVICNSAATCSDVHSNGGVCAVGFENGSTCLLIGETMKVSTILQCSDTTTAVDSNCSADENAQSVESIQFAPVGQLPILATGNVEGNLYLWDINSETLRSKCLHTSGIVKLHWLNENTLISAALDGILRLWDVRNAQMVREWVGHQKEILDFDVSVSANLIASGDGEGICKIFNLN